MALVADHVTQIPGSHEPFPTHDAQCGSCGRKLRVYSAAAAFAWIDGHHYAALVPFMAGVEESVIASWTASGPPPGSLTIEEVLAGIVAGAVRCAEDVIGAEVWPLGEGVFAVFAAVPHDSQVSAEQIITRAKVELDRAQMDAAVLPMDSRLLERLEADELPHGVAVWTT